MLLAKRTLLKPTYLHEPARVETFGPLVADLCDRAGFAPDPEQELILDNVFAIRPDGKPAAFEFLRRLRLARNAVSLNEVSSAP